MSIQSLILTIFSVIHAAPAFGHDHFAQSAVTLNDVRVAKCRGQIPTLSQQVAWINDLSATEPKKNYAVGGAVLKKENSILAQAFKDVYSHSDTALRFTRDMDLWPKIKHLPCETALCFSKALQGEENGVTRLYLRAALGLNWNEQMYDGLVPTEEQKEYFDTYFSIDSWQKGELTPYLKAFFLLPKSSFPLVHLRLTKAKKSAHGDVGQVMANTFVSSHPYSFRHSMVTIFPDLLKTSSEYQEYTMFHELGHVISLGSDWLKEWADVGAWFVHSKHGFATKLPEQLVSQYAAQDYSEDFAESFAAYRYAPEKLKKISPAKYEFMKSRVFGGVEYLSEAQCAGTELRPEDKISLSSSK